MKKMYSVLGAMAGVALMVSCNSISGLTGGTKMDTPEATRKVVDALKKNVKTDEWKVYQVRWMEGEELSGELFSVTVEMINKDNNAFTQTFILAGPTAGSASDLREAIGIRNPQFEAVGGIDFDKIDPAAIQKQYDEAKKQIPEGYTFEGISSYLISEEIPTGNEFMDRGKNMGEIKADFTLNMTEDGKKYVESAGKKSVQYYSMDFDVQPDGSILLKE